MKFSKQMSLALALWVALGLNAQGASPRVPKVDSVALRRAVKRVNPEPGDSPEQNIGGRQSGSTKGSS